MNERIEKLRASQDKDRQRLEELKVRIQKREVQLEELERSELMHRLRVLSTRGLSVDEIVGAIQDRDFDTLALLMEEEKEDEPV